MNIYEIITQAGEKIVVSIVSAPDIEDAQSQLRDDLCSSIEFIAEKELTTVEELKDAVIQLLDAQP